MSGSFKQLIDAAFDKFGVQRESRSFAIAIHIFFKIGAEILKHKVQAGLLVFFKMLHTQQSEINVKTTISFLLLTVKMIGGVLYTSNFAFQLT